MQKTLVTFSLALMLKVRILDIPKLSRNSKRYFVSKLLKDVEGLEK